MAGGVGVDAALNGTSTNQLGGGHALSSLSLHSENPHRSKVPHQYIMIFLVISHKLKHEC